MKTASSNCRYSFFSFLCCTLQSVTWDIWNFSIKQLFLQTIAAFSLNPIHSR